MNDWLAAYVAGSLDDAERDQVDVHLADCARCRADLAVWRVIAEEAPPARAVPAGEGDRMVRAVLNRSAILGSVDAPGTGRRPARLRYLAALMRAELRLIRAAVPIASALVMALGVVLVLVQSTVEGDGGNRAAGAPAGTAQVVLALVAPLVAAAGVAGTFRSRRDPSAELVAAAPLPGRLLLLVRLVLVFGYDLGLAVAASAAVAAAGTTGATGLDTLIAAWLGPMALLSSLSLLIAVRFGPEPALAVAMVLWAGRVLAAGDLAADLWPTRFILGAWTTNGVVLATSVALGAAAVALAGSWRGEPFDGWRATHPA